jgi:hypothetical protein
MITPSFSLTATERVLPRLTLDFTTASLDNKVTFARTGSVSTRVNSSGIVEVVSADEPRFDFDPVTLVCRGLLIESERTNLFNYSQQLDNVYWSKTRLNVTGTPAWVDQAISPDGTQNADKLIEDTSTNTHFIQRTYAAAASTTYTYSVFLKAGERTFATVQVNLFANQVASNVVNINLTTGVFTASDVNRTLVQNFGNGWWRVSTTVTTIASAVNLAPSIFLASALGTTSYTGNGTSGIFAWGMQFEEGAFPTSYIPVEASQVTRTADIATMTGTNFSDWFNNSEGSAVIQAIPGTISGTRPTIAFDDNTANEIIALRGSAADPQLFVVDGGGDQATLDAGTITANTVYKLGGAWKDSSFATAVNGGAVVSQASGTLPTVTQARLGNDGVNYLNGHLQILRYWPQRLINAEVPAFSK